MRILALDAATQTGWCVIDGDFIVSGTWDISVDRTTRANIDTDEAGGMRLANLRRKLNELQQEKTVDILVYEASRNLRYGNPVRVAAELQGVIQLWAIDNMVQFKGYSPSEIKKHATGKGNCNKNAMMVAAFNKWPNVHRMGPSEWSSDEADARFLCDLAFKQLCPIEVRQKS